MKDFALGVAAVVAVAAVIYIGAGMLDGGGEPDPVAPAAEVGAVEPTPAPEPEPAPPEPPVGDCDATADITGAVLGGLGEWDTVTLAQAAASLRGCMETGGLGGLALAGTLAAVEAEIVRRAR